MRSKLFNNNQTPYFNYNKNQNSNRYNNYHNAHNAYDNAPNAYETDESSNFGHH